MSHQEADQGVVLLRDLTRPVEREAEMLDRRPAWRRLEAWRRFGMSIVMAVNGCMGDVSEVLRFCNNTLIVWKSAVEVNQRNGELHITEPILFGAMSCRHAPVAVMSV